MGKRKTLDKTLCSKRIIKRGAVRSQQKSGRGRGKIWTQKLMAAAASSELHCRSPKHIKLSILGWAQNESHQRTCGRVLRRHVILLLHLSILWPWSQEHSSTWHYWPDTNVDKIQSKYWQDLINICIEKTPKSRKSGPVEKAIARGQGVQQPNPSNVLHFAHFQCKLTKI